MANRLFQFSDGAVIAYKANRAQVLQALAQEFQPQVIVGFGPHAAPWRLRGASRPPDFFCFVLQFLHELSMIRFGSSSRG